MKRERLGDYAKTTLVILGLTVGVLTLAAFPGLAIVAKEFLKHHRRRSYSPRTMRTAVYRLRQRGLIRVVTRDDELVMQLTQAGRKALEKLKLEKLAIPKPPQWDGRWRFVAFDVPEKRRRAREAFRDKLKELGFLQVQKSLFVLPYPCEVELAYLTATLEVSPFVQYFTAVSYNGERSMRRRFRV